MSELLRLVQVVAILEAGHPLPFTVKAANLDLPELQGEPIEIAKEKCRLAAHQVNTALAGSFNKKPGT